MHVSCSTSIQYKCTTNAHLEKYCSHSAHTEGLDNTVTIYQTVHQFLQQQLFTVFSYNALEIKRSELSKCRRSPNAA